MSLARSSGITGPRGRTKSASRNVALPNPPLHLTWAARLFSRGSTLLQATPADLDYGWHRAELGRGEQQLKEPYQASTLPDEPPADALHQFLLDLRLASLKEKPR
jgi:hypothetical protein